MRMRRMCSEIIDYIISKYDPHTLIVYGSYADGSNNADSDFDAMLVTDGEFPPHDASAVAGVVLDLFVYPTSAFGGTADYEKYIQVFDANIVIDKRGLGRKLKDGVNAYISSIPLKTDAECMRETEWCEKMLARTQRGDAEGYFRWHWLLMDSLEVYCDIRGVRYFGPKKALREMDRNAPEAMELYSAALRSIDADALKRWVEYLASCCARRM